MVNKTVPESETGNYFWSKTKRKSTCSAVPGSCKRVGIEATGRENCAYKCINNTDDVRAALNGKRCLSFNFETDSGFCEVVDRAYWSGQWHGWGKRYTARIKSDRPNRPEPTDPEGGQCFARVFEYADYEHHSVDTTEDKDLEDWRKNRSGSVKVKNCNGKKAVAFWSDNNEAILLSDAENAKLDSFDAIDKISKIKFYEVPNPKDDEISYDLNVFGLLESNKMSSENAKLVDKSRKDLIPIANKDHLGDPCPGGEMYWKNPQSIRCIYKKDGLDAKLRALHPIVNSDQEPSSSERKVLYDTLATIHCDNIDNYHDVIGGDGLKCSSWGETTERRRAYCMKDDNMSKEPGECSEENMGTAYYNEAGKAYCQQEKYRTDEFCKCYNATHPNLCKTNPELPGCDQAYEWLDPLKETIGLQSYSLLETQKQCPVCQGVTTEFVPDNALKACERDFQICSITANYGQATNADFIAQCNQKSESTEEKDAQDTDIGEGGEKEEDTDDEDEDDDDSPAPSPRKRRTFDDDDEDEDEDEDDGKIFGLSPTVLFFGFLIFLAIIIFAIRN
jgi:hypothetical protein